jgi:glycosyltransferase involved in cell wall biosynthesis
VRPLVRAVGGAAPAIGVTGRVLVVSYFYPPFSGVGSTRVSKMTRYLSDWGWEPHVLTIDHYDQPATSAIEIPEDRITRASMAFDVAALPRAIVGRSAVSGLKTPANGWRAALLQNASWAYRHLLCFPDAQIGWWSTAVAAGRRLIERIRPDVILSSSFPATSHLVARSLARHSGLPWVAELRDLWTANHNLRRIQPLLAIERRLERSVLTEASALVTVAEPLADWLRDHFHRPTYVVPNGYDSADYPKDPKPSRQKFSLVYTGMFYSGRQYFEPLFEAVARLAAAGRIQPDRFTMHFVGQGLAPLVTRSERLGIRAFLTAGPPISYSESLRLQCEATALLVLELHTEFGSGIIPVKLFEYLGAGRPVLSVGLRDSAVARTIERTRVGVVATTADEVEHVLREWLDEFDRTGTIAYAGDEAAKQVYSRQHAAREMARILGEAVGRPSSPAESDRVVQ